MITILILGSGLGMIIAGVWVAASRKSIACRLIGHPGFVGTFVQVPIAAEDVFELYGVEPGSSHRYDCVRCGRRMPFGWARSREK